MGTRATASLVATSSTGWRSALRALAVAAASPHLTGAEAALAARPGPGPLPAGYYPPTATGMQGQHDRVIGARSCGSTDVPNPGRHAAATAARASKRAGADVDDVYDLVVVGAGASGLAAAKYYRTASAPVPRS